MSPQEKAAVSIGANPIHRFPKKYSHVTTANFMEFNVATVMEMPKSSLKCKHKSFMRSFALKRPLLSNINIHKQAYFVPYRTVWEPWSDFRTDTPHNQPEGTGLLTNTPLIRITDLIELLMSAPYSSGETGLTPEQTAHGCDYVVELNSVPYYFTFTPFGRWAYKLLCSMGLPLPFANYDVMDKETTIDALPLLAVAKVYLDYFFPNQYAHYGVYATIDGIMQRQVIYTLTQTEIDTIFNAIYKVAYASDYFISAFDKPLVAADGTQSLDFQIEDITMFGSASNQKSHIKQTSGSSNAGTPYERVASDSTSNVVNHTQYMDTMLKALTNYIRRHSLAGSRALTRYLADWGVVLSADKLKRCYKLGECVFPVQVGDVVATSDTYNSSTDEGASLGDYAGRSVAFNGDFDFECDTDEDGLLVVTYSVVPSVSYVQGIQRYWLHKTKLDFLTGEFDGKYEREIQRIELFVGKKRPVDFSGLFGFSPSYAEYKIDYDTMSGDFMVDSKNLGLMGFESARKFSDDYGDDYFSLGHGLDFIIGNDANQYNRIFVADEDSADNFIFIHRAEFEHNIPAVPLWDNYDFEDGKKQIQLQVNGSKDI